MMDGQPTWETTSTDSGSDSSSDENDIGVASAIPRLFIRTPSLVGPAHLVPLTDEIHRLLTVEQNMFSVFLQACTYHKVQSILEAMNGFRISHKTAAEKLRKALGKDASLLGLFVTTYPCIFAEGNDDYAFTPYNTPLILRPTYVGEQDESHVYAGRYYDTKVSQLG